MENKGQAQNQKYIEGKKETKQVHQMVAESFLNHIPCGYKLVVNHIDFNRTNNAVQNLELVSARENSNRNTGRPYRGSVKNDTL